MNKNIKKEITETDLINELNYLVAEGFVVYNPIDETYRMKTEEEFQKELENA